MVVLLLFTGPRLLVVVPQLLDGLGLLVVVSPTEGTRLLVVVPLILKELDCL